MNTHTEKTLEFSQLIHSTERTCTIALAGQPNQGKSTIFNILTGLNQHVGNWPGKTVERREGEFEYEGRNYRIIDLPGTYSLTANSPEELISREYILHNQPDVVVAVVNAANLERSLYLVSELVGLPAPLVIALNMMDVAEQEGVSVQAEVLEAAMGAPVIPMTATRASGIKELLAAIEKIVAGEHTLVMRLPDIRPDHRKALDDLIQIIKDWVPKPYPLEWTGVKLLEGDIEIIRMMRATLPAKDWDTVHSILRDHDDALLAVASGRYEWIDRMIRAAVVRPKKGQIGLTDRIDRWATHPVFGIFILAGVLGLVFGMTFTLGTPLQQLIDSRIIVPLADFVSVALRSSPFWLRGLLIDGILGGVGTVLSFLPILMIFFAAFGLLEDLGYMARAAYVMDNFMHLMGLHGKSFLPLFLGFGCNVPAVMGARVIDSWQARLLTILVAPFVPCTARMAVIAFIAPVFFGANAIFVTWGVVLLSLMTLVVAGMLINRAVFKGERSAFIMEMPLYHLPNWRTIGLLVWQRAVSFVKKASSIILFMSVLVWVFATLPGGDIETSYLAQIGRFIEPVGQWMGLDWRLSVALITSVVAKENSVATIGVLLGHSSDAGLSQMLASSYSMATGLSFLIVATLFVPCVPTIATIRQETGSLRWMWFTITMFLVVSLTMGAGVYQLTRLAGM